MSEKLARRRCYALQKPLVLVPVILFLLAIGAPVNVAQEPTTRTEFWPEIDLYIHVKPKVRLFFLGTVSKSVEDGELFGGPGSEAQFGVHVDYIPNDHIILRTGYRYSTAIGSNNDPFREHRLITEQTFRKLLPADLIVSDRNRQDFRLIDGDFSFRYRNRVTFEREFHLPKWVPKLLTRRSITPYVTGEISYDTRFSAWNRNRLAVGFQQSLRRALQRKMGLPRRQVILDFYFMTQNDSRAQTQHLKAVGLALNYFF
jgi:hypothetical protein